MSDGNALLELLQGQGWIGTEVLFQRSSYVNKSDFNSAVASGKRLGLLKIRSGRVGLEVALPHVSDEPQERPDAKAPEPPAGAGPTHTLPPQAKLLEAPRTLTRAARVEPEPKPAFRLPGGPVIPPPTATNQADVISDARRFVSTLIEHGAHVVPEPPRERAPNGDPETIVPAPAPHKQPPPRAQPQEAIMPKQRKTRTVREHEPEQVPTEKIAEFILALLRTSGPMRGPEISLAIGHKPVDGVAAYWLKKLFDERKIEKADKRNRLSPWRLREPKAQQALRAKGAEERGQGRASKLGIPVASVSAKLRANEERAAADAEQRRNHQAGASPLRCAIWNNGQLSLRGRQLEGELDPDEVRDLFRYLDATLPADEKGAAA